MVSMSIILAMLRACEFSRSRVDKSMAMCDAKTIYEAMENGACLDTAAIISLLSGRSMEQLRSILQCYKELYGHDLSKSLRREKFEEFGKDLKRVIKCVEYPHKHFAKQLRKAWSNGQRESNVMAQEGLIRIVVTRHEIDMEEIERAFCNKSGVSLEMAIHKEIKDKNREGLMGDFLLALLKPH
ncbi:annexin D7 [Amborella trichopoda]|nr:annexin D7 [Amborella trichopoda]|eukprot:XP_006826964.3 annexin D7 [Amborella trichopoda]